MEHNGQNEQFNYHYSAGQQAEVERIRKKYLPDAEADKMARLRALDASVTRKGTVVSLIIGIVSALLLGVGMCLIMTPIGAALGTVSAFLIGIAVGLVGIGGLILSYPVYQAITARERARLAPEILRLSEELLGE
ncbi:MAG: hypothetical protein IJW29_09325 [Clostridia bacterium]|nr:hypothetical protein [Clostridia bacterium]MBQ9785691.1 hypothetical protein [Clostridia bacterium]